MARGSACGPAPRGEHRMMYVSDPSTISRLVLPDPVTEADLRRWVDWVADSGVDTFTQEVFSQGWTVYWKSETYEYDQRPQHRHFLPLIESGAMPVEILIDQSRQRGMRFIAGFRMNDGHAGHNRRAGIGVAEFIESHPELRLHDPRPGPSFQEPEALDFTFEEVRDFTFGVVKEVASRFDIDGVELCFRETAYFPPDEAPGRAHLMTGLIRRVRAMLDARGSRAGKKLILGARVFASTEECAHQGLDVRGWIREGLLDYVSPQDAMYADFNVPYAEWSALTRATDCMLYPGLNPWLSVRARYRLGRTPLQHALFRGLAHTMYESGADGMSIYNHFVPCVWHPPFYPQAMQTFHQLRDPERVARGERQYFFDPTYAGYTGCAIEGMCGTGTIKAQQVRLERGETGASGEFHFQLYEDLRNTYGATLLFRGFGLTENDELGVCLNGRTVPEETIGRTASTDHATPVDTRREHDGKRIPCVTEGGRIDFRAGPDNPPPAFATRWFVLKDGMLERGENCLLIALTRSDPEAKSEAIVIDEVEVFVEPR